MNFIQEVLNLIERKEDKKKLDLKRDWFEFGRSRSSSVGNPGYAPKMNPHAIRFDNLKCSIISGLVSGTGTEHTLPMWSTVDSDNCNVQTIIDSIFSQNAGATEGVVSGNLKVTGNTVIEGDLLVLGTQTIVESTVVQVADNIMRINSAGNAFDAGIEVIQPDGTKTWAWNNADALWSTFGDSINTQDIHIDGGIKQDGETIINVVNEAEGLASNDNDQSYATVAAIIDWTDQMTLDVTADTGSVDILLNSEALNIVGGDIITTSTDAAETITISHDAVGVTVNNPSAITLGYGAQFPRKLVGAENVTHDGHGHLTGFWAERLIMPDWLGLTNVELNGNSLDFTSTSNSFGGFTGSIDLSGFVDEYTLVPDVGPGDRSYGIISLFQNGVSVSGFKVYTPDEWIEIESDGAEMNIYHSPAPDLLAAISDVTLNHGDTFSVQSYVFDSAGHVIDLESVNYTLPTLDSAGVLGIEILNDQHYTLDFEPIGTAPSFSAGFENTSGSTKNYFISYTIQNKFSPGITTQEFVNYSVEIVSDIAGSVNQITEYPEEVFVQDGSVFQTSHSYTAVNVPTGAKIFLRIKGNVNLIMEKTAFSVVETHDNLIGNGNAATIVL